MTVRLGAGQLRGAAAVGLRAGPLRGAVAAEDLLAHSRSESSAGAVVLPVR